MILELGKTYNVSVRLCNYSVITSDLKLIKVTHLQKLISKFFLSYLNLIHQF